LRQLNFFLTPLLIIEQDGKKWTGGYSHPVRLISNMPECFFQIKKNRFKTSQLLISSGFRFTANQNFPKGLLLFP
jgi:hypothetical protein